MTVIPSFTFAERAEAGRPRDPGRQRRPAARRMRRSSAGSARARRAPRSSSRSATARSSWRRPGSRRARGHDVRGHDRRPQDARRRRRRSSRDKRFVDNGKIITSAGLSSGIDGALHVIEKLYGKGTAQVAAVGMEYDWRPDSGWARASLADQHLAPASSAGREYPAHAPAARGHAGALGDELEDPHRRRRRRTVLAAARQGLRRLARLEEAVRAGSVALRGRAARRWTRDDAGRAGRGREGPDVVTVTVARAR